MSIKESVIAPNNFYSKFIILVGLIFGGSILIVYTLFLDTLSIRLGQRVNLSSLPELRDPPLILIYADKRYMPANYDPNVFYYKDLPCEKKCHFTYNKNRWNDSISVLIRETFPSGNYPPRFSTQQRIILTIKEAAARIGMIKGLKRIPKNYVNFTFGFMHEFDFHTPYDLFWKQETSMKELAKIKNVLSNKNNSAFIVYSHCKTESRREDYIKEFQRHFQIDTFGKCGTKRCDSTCMSENLRDYHFYLAFENNICEDYVTEKVSRMKDLILPIVFRDKDYQDRLPKNSYIAVDQFKKVEDLVIHLVSLMMNNTAYQEYFKWTKEYSLKKGTPLTRQLCAVCKNAYNTTFRQYYQDISKFYSPERRCDNDLIPQLLKTQFSNDSKINQSGGLSNWTLEIL